MTLGNQTRDPNHPVATDPDMAGRTRGGTHIFALRSFTRWWLAWLVIYMGSSFLLPNEDLFVGAVDRVDADLIKVLFLNMPLQVALIGLALVIGVSPRPTNRRIGNALGAVAVTLALIHGMIAVATA